MLLFASAFIYIYNCPLVDKQNQDITINFSLVPGRPGNPLERVAFWDAPSTVQWFRERGYTLYKRQPYEVEDQVSFATFPSVTPEEGSPAEYPYAHYDLDSKTPLRTYVERVCLHYICH